MSEPRFKQFCDSHCHSHFSLLDGISSPEDNVKRAKELGMPALAISDHGTLAGMPEFYFACKKHGVTPMLGIELYWKRDLAERDPTNKYHHGIILAMNKTGYENLLMLSSIGFREDHKQYGKPVVSQQEIMDNSEGLVFSTGCMVGLTGVSQGRDMDYSRSLLAPLAEAFKGRIVIEAGPAQVCMEYEKATDTSPERWVPNPRGDLQVLHNQRAIQLGKEFGIPLIIASDSHMAKPELKPVQDLVIKSTTGGWHFHQTHAMASSDATWDDLQRYHPYVTEYQYREWIDNTYLVRDLVKGLTLQFAPMIPPYPAEKHPLYQAGMTPKQLMLAIIKANGRLPANPAYYERLKEEIATICDNGLTDYSSYFLILADMARHAKENDIPMGVARGSAGGCLLSYLLGITNIDPIRWNLSFTRFLNVARLGEPLLSFPEYPFREWKSNRAKLLTQQATE